MHWEILLPQHIALKGIRMKNFVYFVMQTITGILAITLCLRFTQTATTIVRTDRGLIRGTQMLDYYQQPYFVFQSVPYAKPPLGKLRFQPPQKPLSWRGIRDCTQLTPACLQPMENGTLTGFEDCLYLNVFTKAINTRHLMPVIMFIQGGGLIRQAVAMVSYNPMFLITENVVIVTINHRLGALGFVTLDDDDSNAITANNGFRDQIMAMEWVKRNIGSFGGDRNSITLSGVSAGAVSVHYHVFSPLSKGLFHKIICRSGQAIQSTTPISNNTAYVLAEQLGIPTNDLPTMVRKLKMATAEEIFQAETDIRWFDFYLNKPMLTGLHIEQAGPNSFMSEEPIVLAKRGEFQTVPMMFSNVDREGLLLNTTAMPNMNSITNISLHIPALFGANSAKVLSAVKAYYFRPQIDDPLVTFWGDIWFKYPGYRTMQIVSRYQKVYVASFHLDTKLNVFKLTHDTIAPFKGACHTDDDSYIYYSSLTQGPILPDSLEGLWMRRMIRLQANFIKYSTPTPYPDPLLDNIIWDPYSPLHDNAIIFTNDNITMGRFRPENYNFWKSMYSQYANGL